MISPKRDNRYLASRLIYLWKNHFADIVPKNKVIVKFSRISKYRFGSIRLDPKTKDSIILINGNFKKREVPEEVIDHTLAHELAHYAHGFSSPYERLHAHPHKGGVIDRELRKRRLGHLIIAYKSWLKGYVASFKNAR